MRTCPIVEVRLNLHVLALRDKAQRVHLGLALDELRLGIQQALNERKIAPPASLPHGSLASSVVLVHRVSCIEKQFQFLKFGLQCNLHSKRVSTTVCQLKEANSFRLPSSLMSGI